LRSAGQEMLDPIQALERCNRLLCSERPEDYGVRTLYMVLDPASGSIKYANAGQPQFFIAGPEIKTEQFDAGPPMGTRLEMDFIQGEVDLAMGESLVIMSPSLMGAKNYKKEPFKQKAPEVLAREHMDMQAMAENIFLEHERFVDRGGQKGTDLSVLILRRLKIQSE
jgi:serine phosphatase RsbU (regulator of sigma subunit)